MMAMCESDRGEWGGICPDCGERLPQPQPLRSWQSQRPLAFEAGSSAGLGSRNEGLVLARLARITRQAVSSPSSDGLTDRQREIQRIVAKNGGNVHAAARELGIAKSTVFVSLKRSGAVA